jgi:hypothetical protein
MPEEIHTVTELLREAPVFPSVSPQTAVLAGYSLSTVQTAMNVSKVNVEYAEWEVARASNEMAIAQGHLEAAHAAEDGGIILAFELDGHELDVASLRYDLAEIVRADEASLNGSEIPLDVDAFEAAYGGERPFDGRRLFSRDMHRRIAVAEVGYCVARATRTVVMAEAASMDRQALDLQSIKQEIRRLSRRFIWAATAAGTLLLGGTTYSVTEALTSNHIAIASGYHESPQELQSEEATNEVGDAIVGTVAGGVAGVTILAAGLGQEDRIARRRATRIVRKAGR